MDARNHNAQTPGQYASQPDGNFALSGPSNDQFSSYTNPEEYPQFESWQNQAYSGNPSTSGFQGGYGHGQHAQAWQAASGQENNATSSYGQHARGYEQGFSKHPTFSNYSPYGQEVNPVFGSSNYSAGQLYHSNASNPRYDYNSHPAYQQSSQTISPHALQAHQASQQNAPTHQYPIDAAGNVSGSRGSGGEPPSKRARTDADWKALVSPDVQSMPVRDMLIKPTKAFSNATDSSNLKDFVFVGNKDVEISIPKMPYVAPARPRKSLANLRRQLEQEIREGRKRPDHAELLRKLTSATDKLSRAGKRKVASVTVKASQPPGTSTPRSASVASASEVEDSSEDDAVSDTEDEDDRSPVPLSRPLDPSKAKEYDIVKTVWAKRSRTLAPIVIRTALSECWDIFKVIRDEWKKKLISFQQAVDKKDVANKAIWTRRVMESRKLFVSCLKLTMQHGHPSIVEKVAEHPSLLVVFYQFIADRITQNEHAGELITSILELVNRCNSLDSSTLAATKIDKVLSRIAKKGDVGGRVLAQKILDKAAAVSPKKKESTSETVKVKAEVNGSGASGTLNARNKEVPKVVTAVKKEVDDVKRPLKKAMDVKTLDSTKLDKTTAAGKVKVVTSTAKPSSFFSSLQSASKKAGTSSKGKDAKPLEPVAKKEEPKAPPAPAYSFTAALANLTSRKDKPVAAEAKAVKPETPEEKAKRARKERRRGLRVSFKNDDELCQIREFYQDPEEKIHHNRGDNHDMADSKGEGTALKMHKELEDEEDEYEPPEDIELDRPWVAPFAMDFSEMDQTELAKNWTATGGPQEPESNERKIQDQRDSSTLMVVYPDARDIPSTPREPPNEMIIDYTEELFGQPDYTVMARSAEYLSRNDNGNAAPAVPAPAPVQAPTAPTFDISRILQMVNGPNYVPQQQTYQPSRPSPSAAPTGTGPVDLATILARVRNVAQATQPVQTPAPVVSQQPASAPVSSDLRATLDRLSQMSQDQQQDYEPPPAIVAPPVSQPNEAPANLQAIFARLNGQQAQQEQQAPAGQASNGNTMSHAGYDNSRKRPLEEDENYMAKKRAHPLALTQTCTYWLKGECRKGDICTYKHEK